MTDGDTGPYMVTRRHPHDLVGGTYRRQAIVDGPFTSREQACVRARELEAETAAQGRRWQETTGLPMPWTNGAVTFFALSIREIARGSSMGMEFPYDPNPFPALPHLDDWESTHNLGEIKRMRFYMEPIAAWPGWERFVACDPRFPLSLAFPSDWAGSTFFDFNREEWLVADFDHWVIVREDLLAFRARGDRLATEILSQPGQFIRTVLRYSDRLSRLKVGRDEQDWPYVRKTRWPRPPGAAHGPYEAVLVLDDQGALWHFGRPDQASEDTYLRALASVEWLPASFFAEIDARLARLDSRKGRPAPPFSL